MFAAMRGREPLRIDHVTVGDAGGVVGMCECPGRTEAYGMGWDVQRDLAEDLATIGAFDAAALVTLFERHEFALLGVSEVAFRDGAAAHGYHWRHLPITDMHPPDHRFERGWETAGPALRGLLDAGRTVVFHCRAGLGRTGTIAARLLIELGTAPDEAIARVRAARPGAIETSRQQVYLEGLG